MADGKFDAREAAFTSVKLWGDWSQASMVESGELLTFAALGIQSISVTGTTSNVDLGGGNTQTFSGSFTRVGGQTGASGTAELAGSLLLANNNRVDVLYDSNADDLIMAGGGDDIVEASQHSLRAGWHWPGGPDERRHPDLHHPPESQHH